MNRIGKIILCLCIVLALAPAVVCAIGWYWEKCVVIAWGYLGCVGEFCRWCSIAFADVCQNNEIAAIIVAALLLTLLVVSCVWRCGSGKRSRHGGGPEIMYVSDEPIKAIRDDKLKRLPTVLGIADVIQYYPCNEQAAFVAVFGDWGDGKTSARYMIEEHLKDKTDSISFVDFSPWKYAGDYDLQSVYFDVLAKHLSTVCDRETARKCRNLSVALACRQVNKSVGSLHWVVDIVRACLFDVKKSEDSLREKLRGALLASGKRIVVVIDDLERLPEDQVCDVLRFLKANCDLPGIVYLVLSDEKYLTAAACSLVPPGLGEDSANGRRYLEKIFSVCIELPRIRGDVLSGYLRASVLSILGDNSIDKNQECDFDEEARGLINNMRTLKRVLNTFLVDVQIAKGFAFGHIYLNKHIGDMLSLGMLRLRMPDVYKVLPILYWSVVKASSPFDDSQRVDLNFVKDVLPKLESADFDFVMKFMETRLGFYYDSSRKSYLINRPSSPDRLIGYRMSSALVFDDYFQVDAHEKLLPEDDLREFLRAIDGGRYPEELIARLNDDGSISKLLYALEATDAHVNELQVRSYLSALIRMSNENLRDVSLPVGYESPLLGDPFSVYRRIYRCLLIYMTKLKKQLMEGRRIGKITENVGDFLLPILRESGGGVFVLGCLIEDDWRHHREDGTVDVDATFSDSEFEGAIKLFFDLIPEFTKDGNLIAHVEFFRIIRTWLALLKKKGKNSDLKLFRARCGVYLEDVHNIYKIIAFFAKDNKLSGSLSDQLEVEVDLPLMAFYFGESAAKKVLATLKTAPKMNLYFFHFYLSLRWAVEEKRKGNPCSVEEQGKALLEYIGSPLYKKERSQKVDETLGSDWYGN